MADLNNEGTLDSIVDMPNEKRLNNRSLYTTVFLFGAFAVIFGAFGAHYLAEHLAAKQLASFKTGVLYHFIHVLAALIVLLFSEIKKSKALRTASKLFIIGIILFSGSLYLLSTRELIGLISYKWLGPITPIGGLFFITGWLRAALYFIKK